MLTKARWNLNGEQMELTDVASRDPFDPAGGSLG